MIEQENILEEKVNEEIIFQVRINRENQELDFVKLKLSPFEQSAFELFLRNYVDSCNKMRLEDFKIDIFDIEEDK